MATLSQNRSELCEERGEGLPVKVSRARTVVSAILLLLMGVVAGIALVSNLRLLPEGQAVNESNEAKGKPPRLLPDGQGFVEIAKLVTPAVVNISTTRVVRPPSGFGLPFNDPFFRRFFGDDLFPGMPRKYKEQSLGSGVIVDPNGLVITNNHVILGADDILVSLQDRRDFKGTIVGGDEKSDVAVIRITATDLPTIPWGDSDTLQVGEYVVAVGNPFGLNQTVTMGIVSAVGRANVGITDYENFIQTDAAINPGNSGGAMVNIRGELVGINTAIFTRSGGYMGIGFAVPSNMARSIMDSLVKTGKVVRGWLGVAIQDITPALAKEFGVKERKGALVTDVSPGSPADKAGIKRGDVIIALKGQDVENVSALRNKVASLSAGMSIEVRIIRNKKEKEIFVTIGEGPKEITAEESKREGTVTAKSFGMDVVEITPELAEQWDLPEKTGVMVKEVEAGSVAGDAGIREGDMIIEINHKRINNLSQYENALAKVKKGEPLLFLMNRQGNLFFLTLSLEEE